MLVNGRGHGRGVHDGGVVVGGRRAARRGERCGTLPAGAPVTELMVVQAASELGLF